MILEKLLDMLLVAPAFLLAITVHEFMHGRVAYALGDTTARDHGRLSLNPIKHLDPLGTLMIFITSFYGYGFGWAKPVPVNPYHFRNPRRDMALVSLAGPAANFLAAFLVAKVLLLFVYGLVGNGIVIDITGALLQKAVILNVMLGIFNLLPIPPLDGSKLIPTILPDSMQQGWFRFEQYGFVILLALMFMLPGFLSTVIYGPIGEFMLRLVLAPIPMQ